MSQVPFPCGCSISLYISEFKVYVIPGPDCPFYKESALLEVHHEAKSASLEKFDSIANMGVQSAINAKR